LSQAEEDQFNSAFGINLLNGYGLTEASPVVAANTPKNFKPGTVGKPLHNVAVKVISDDGVPLPPGSCGEICVFGPSVMERYCNVAAETQEMRTTDGWLRTGDHGSIDDDGFITVSGRKKEMIIVAGENVFPNEIESVILEMPQVAEVAVTAAQDEVHGEVPQAFVVPVPGMELPHDDVRAHCHKRLPGFKVPRRIIVSDELPKNAAGKIVKRLLK